MSIDWDGLVLGPAMGIFGEGQPTDPSTWPTYTPRGQSPFALAYAVFDAEYESVTVDADGVPTSSRRPVLGVRMALFAHAPAQNDLVFIPSTAKNYIVSDVHPDGHGFAKLVLVETA
jgi:hypothetical protein